MKKLLAILIIVILTSCAGGGKPKTYYQDVETKFYITYINKAKYSKVEGYIIYNTLKVPADNGSSGYYYKEYGNLREGGSINIKVRVYTDYEYTRTILTTEDLDLSKYETN